MKFNDYQIIGEKESRLLSQNYTKILEKEVSDLTEILDKMNKQKDELIMNNSSGEYNEIIAKLLEDIDKLNGIVYSTKNHYNYRHSGYTLNIPSELRKVHKMQDDSRLSPYRSLDEMEGHNDQNINNSSPLPNDNNTNGNFPNAGNSTPDNLMTNQHSTRRGHPMQRYSIIDIIKQATRMNKGNKKTPILAEKDRKRFHTIIVQDCHPRNRLISGQIDIIRLLLLYLTLRPNCKYTSMISTIASDQFDVYLKLKDKWE